MKSIKPKKNSVILNTNKINFRMKRSYKKINKSDNKTKYKLNFYLVVIIIIQFLVILYCFFRKKINSNPIQINNKDDNSEENLENFDSNILIPIRYIQIRRGDQKFLNGIIRKYKPKKIVEMGVSAGGSSALILNAIKDIPNAKLYSIDRYNNWYINHSKLTGWLVKEQFPELMNKWTLYTGKTTAEFMESIGDNIDLVYIDTAHYTPGEMLNWLDVLPFLKEEAIVVFHDIFLMFQKPINSTKNFSNNQLLCYIRGKLILPSYGNNIFNRNIGAIKLEKNQKRYYKQYFLALGNNWNYFLEEKDIIALREHYKKYYGEKLTKIYDNAVEKNRIRLIKGVIKIIEF